MHHWEGIACCSVQRHGWKCEAEKPKFRRTQIGLLDLYKPANHNRTCLQHRKSGWWSAGWEKCRQGAMTADGNGKALTLSWLAVTWVGSPGLSHLFITYAHLWSYITYFRKLSTMHLVCVPSLFCFLKIEWLKLKRQADTPYPLSFSCLLWYPKPRSNLHDSREKRQIEKEVGVWGGRGELLGKFSRMFSCLVKFTCRTNL